MTSRIAKPLLKLATPLTELSAFPGNPRQGDVGAISESLRSFGQLKPIVVQAATGHIVAGNHLFEAAKALGWTEVAAVHVDMDDLTARRFNIADNRTQELGDYDQSALASILTELAAADALSGTGYDGEDVDQLLAELAAADGTPRRGRAKSNACAFCGEPGERFQLKLQFLRDDEEVSRGAGSMPVCETHWLVHAQPHMKHPAISFEALKSREEEEDDGEAVEG